MRTVARVRFGSGFEELSVASFVVEGARESIPVKQDVFRSPNTVLAAPR
ncbi:hypothetical protein [Streptomyces violascens]